MEEIFVYNALFLQLSATFANFLLAAGHDSLFVATRFPVGYLNTMFIDMELVTYLLPKDARAFIHHLTGAICGCTFCEEVAQLPIPLCALFPLSATMAESFLRVQQITISRYPGGFYISAWHAYGISNEHSTCIQVHQHPHRI